MACEETTMGQTTEHFTLETDMRKVDSEEGVLALLRAAQTPQGLQILLMLAEDPTLCETIEGFALRLHCTPQEVRDAIHSLHEVGVLNASPGPANRGSASYWLSSDTGLMASIRRLMDVYFGSPAGRYDIMQAVQTGGASA